MGGVLSGVGAIAGIGGSLSKMFGGGGNDAPTASQAVQPAANPWEAPYVNGQGGVNAAGSYVSGIPGLSAYNMWPQLLPQAQGVVNGFLNNPAAAGYQSTANNAGAMGVTNANNISGVGGQLMGAYGMVSPWANQLYQTAFDPQSALYDRTAGQVQQGTRAALEARGLNSSPYGAGVEAGANSNFNIDWQNQQLQRQLQGAQGAGGLLQTGAGITNLGSQLQALAPGLAFQSGAMPFQASQQIAQGQLGALSQLGGYGQNGQNQAQSALDNWLAYMKAAQGTSTAATGATNSQLAGNQINYNQNQQNLNNTNAAGTQLGGSLAALGKAWPDLKTGWASLGSAFS